MATSASSSATAAPASASNTNFLQTLGAGSGIDVKSLAKSLADAEISPERDRVNASITKTQTRISGYGALNYALSQLKAAFEKLNDRSDFGTPRLFNTQPDALGVTAGSSAAIGSQSIEVLQLARPQRNVSGGFASATTPLNGGQAFSLSLTVGSGAPQTIAVGTATPQGLVNAINGANLGVTAQIVQTGNGANPFAVVLTGQNGSAQSFSMSSTSSDVDFSQQLNAASDAQLRVNGLSITRQSNTLTDVLPGVTLNLYAPTSGAARVDLSRDTQTAKDNIKALVSAYNDFDQSLKILQDRKSEVETLGGSLAGDSLVRNVRNQVRDLIISNASTPGTSLSAARDVGLSFDRNGRLTLDETKLDRALGTNFDDVTKIFSAGTDNKSLFSNAPAGLAGDAVVRIDRLIRASGLVSQQTDTANKDLAKYKDQLKALDTKMQKILDRYTNQFAAMDALVSQTNSLKSSLKSTFDNMSGSK